MRCKEKSWVKKTIHLSSCLTISRARAGRNNFLNPNVSIFKTNNVVLEASWERQLVSVIWILVIWYCFEFRISIFGFRSHRNPSLWLLLGAFLIPPVLLVVADFGVTQFCWLYRYKPWTWGWKGQARQEPPNVQYVEVILCFTQNPMTPTYLISRK